MLSVLITLFSCTNWKDKPVSPEEKQKQLESRNDSFSSVVFVIKSGFLKFEFKLIMRYLILNPLKQ